MNISITHVVKHYKNMLAALALILAPALVQAAGMPAVPPELQGKVITLVVPYAPGGETDTTQRYLAAQVEKLSGLKIVVVNKLGNSGTIAAREVADSRADGLTLFGHDNGAHVVQPAVNFPNAIDRKRLRPITVLTLTPLFMYTGADSAYQSLDEIIKAARTNPKFTVGVSAAPHTLMSHGDFWSRLGIDPYYVMYRGAADVAIAANQKDIDVFMTTASTGSAFVQAGKIRPVGVAWRERLPLHPDTAPLSRAAKDFEAYNLQMVSAPADTPEHLLRFYNHIWRSAANTDESRQRWRDLSIIHTDLDLDGTARFLEQEYQQAVKRSSRMPQIAKP